MSGPNDGGMGGFVAVSVLPPPEMEESKLPVDVKVAEPRGAALNGKPVRVLEWNIEDCSVKARRAFKKVRILERVAGRVESGDVVAILGPSGSGKTTFLECLSLRNPHFKGAIHLDNQPVTGGYFRDLGYVHQNELFFAHMTVREHLSFHAINRNGGAKSHAECEAMVDAVIEEMGLGHAADTLIGGGFLYYTKGISGGERKRLAIATELLSEPGILLLDEPTSGLDSVMGELICLHLQKMVEERSRIIMATIHSPSVRMWDYFNKVMLFTGRGGHLAYLGDKEGAEALAAELGHVRPKAESPAEFLLGMVSLTRLDVKKGVLMPSSDYEVLYKTYEQRRAQEGFKPIPCTSSHKSVRPMFKHRSSFLTQLGQNCRRFGSEVKRDKAVLVVMFCSNMIMGLIFGLLYFNQLSSGRNVLCMLFALLITQTILANGHVALNFPLPWQIFTREVYVGANSSLPYFLGSCTADMPRLLIIATSAIVPYFCVGMQFGAPFFKYMLGVVLVVWGAGSIAYLGSSFSHNPAIGILLTTMFTVPGILFSGLLYDPNTVPMYLGWLQEVSIIRFGFASLLANFCVDPTHAHYNLCTTWTHFVSVDAARYVADIVRLVILVLVFRVAAYLVMATKVNLRL